PQGIGLLLARTGRHPLRRGAPFLRDHGRGNGRHGLVQGGHRGPPPRLLAPARGEPLAEGGAGQELGRSQEPGIPPGQVGHYMVRAGEGEAPEVSGLGSEVTAENTTGQRSVTKKESTGILLASMISAVSALGAT